MNSRNLKIGYNISVVGDGISRGTKFSNTHKENMKKSWTIKRRKSHSENLTGKNNPFYGKSHSEKTITEISKKAKDRKLSVETKNKISLATKGAPKPIGFGDTRKGSLNGRAKKYTLISPLNETYHANGNIHELVNEHNLFWRFLIKYKNSQIPLMIIKGKCKTAKENSIGWSLYDNE